MEKHAIVVLADGFEEIEAIAPVDLMRRADILVTLLGLTSLEIRGSHNIVVKADMLFDEFKDPFDAIILPGGPGHKHLLSSSKVLKTLLATHRRGQLCAAICAAPTVLAKAGILAGKKATCFPGYETALDGAIFVDSKTVTDETIITSRSAGTAIDFGLAIVSYLAGESAARTLAQKIVFSIA